MNEENCYKYYYIIKKIMSFKGGLVCFNITATFKHAYFNQLPVSVDIFL